MTKTMIKLVNWFPVAFRVTAWGEVEGVGERELWCLDFRRGEVEHAAVVLDTNAAKATEKSEL